MEEKVYVKTMPSGKEIVRLYYTRVNMWKVPVSELRALKLDGLLPLIPLSKDGENLKVIEDMAEELRSKEQYNLLTIAKAFTEFRIGNKVDQAWIERVFYMSRDILENTPTIRRAKQEEAEKQKKVQEEQRAHTLKVNSDALQALIQLHFPDLVALASKMVRDVKDPNVIPVIMVKISMAKDEQSAIRALNELANQ